MGKLTIEYESLATWMTINNTFTAKLRDMARDEEFDKEALYRTGVMIQLGEFTDFRDNKTPIVFESITLRGGDGNEIRLSREAFERDKIWINLIPNKLPRTDRGDEELPMSRADRSELFPDNESTIHKRLKPFQGGITIWPEGELKLAIKPYPDAGQNHVRRTHVFEWTESMRALVFRHGDDEPLHDIPGVLEVTIREGDGLPDGIHQDPPQRP